MRWVPPKEQVNLWAWPMTDCQIEAVVTESEAESQVIMTAVCKILKRVFFLSCSSWTIIIEEGNLAERRCW